MSAQNKAAIDQTEPAAIDHVLMERLVGLGVGDATAADTLIQAAAAVAVYRQVRLGEPLATRRALFGRVIDLNVLAQTPAKGRA